MPEKILTPSYATHCNSIAQPNVETYLVNIISIHKIKNVASHGLFLLAF